MIDKILEQFGILEFKSDQLVTGLINKTWRISTKSQDYILQRVNDNVFRKPGDVADNIQRIDDYLKENAPGYLFVASVNTTEGKPLVYIEADGYYRLFPFVQGSHTINVVSSPEQAFEAAFQFGKFTKLLSGFEASSLHLTIPDFHNLTLRYRQFEDAITNGNGHRIRDVSNFINEIHAQKDIVVVFEDIRRNPSVKQRVTHHDTKISNVLFNDKTKGICVIDLDTVMPGYFFSDVGDMMRTYLSPANEEEKDFDKIEVREDFFRAIVYGYLANMRDELSEDEKALIYYSGPFLIYMQAIRFLADHCNNDSYYGASYEGHNLNRAVNQLRLLNKYNEKKLLFQEIISKELQSKNHHHS
ncbi:MAG: aminoglycoside phosphotransferase family protein [Chryseolinea sp.]